MSERVTVQSPGSDLLEHPAVKAWAQLRPERVEPSAIERLQKKKKGFVYRLEGVGPGSSAIIAKRSSPARILQERTIYERVLPRLAIPAVRYHGFIEEPEEGCCWLFLEDAGPEEYSPLSQEHRALAGQWLGLLHTSAARLGEAARLPDRGPGYYLEHLRAARDTIRQYLTNPALTADDVTVLNAVVAQCKVVASHWSQVEALCEGMPRTLIHGDFAPKNMRVQSGQIGLNLLPFDWGSAGWGVTAADLVQSGMTSHSHWDYWASPDLAAYCRVVRESWPHLDLPHIQSLAIIGKIFRCLVCIRLDAESLTTEWVEKSMRNMRIYQAEMADGIRAAEWEN